MQHISVCSFHRNRQSNFDFKTFPKKRPPSSGPAAKKDEVQDKVKPKKLKRVDTEFLDGLKGETKATCNEHINAMGKAMSKSTNRNVAMVKELMMITYAIWLSF